MQFSYIITIAFLLATIAVLGDAKKCSVRTNDAYKPATATYPTIAPVATPVVTAKPTPAPVKPTPAPVVTAKPTLAPVVQADVLPKTVCMYTLPNYKGESVCFEEKHYGDLCEDVHDGCNGKFNDKIRSIKFSHPSEQTLRIYKHRNFNTFYAEIGQDVASVEAKFGDFTSFFIIAPPKDNTVCMYPRQNYEGVAMCFPKGYSQDICAGNKTVCRAPWRELVQSVRFGPSTTPMSLELYAKSKYVKKLTTISADQSPVRSLYRRFISFKVL